MSDQKSSKKKWIIIGLIVVIGWLLWDMGAFSAFKRGFDKGYERSMQRNLENNK